MTLTHHGLSRKRLHLIAWGLGIMASTVGCGHAERPSGLGWSPGSAQHPSDAVLEIEFANTAEPDSLPDVGDRPCRSAVPNGTSDAGPPGTHADDARLGHAASSQRSTTEPDSGVYVPEEIPLNPCDRGFFDLTVKFEPGTAMPRPDADGVIDVLVTTLRNNPNLELLEVRGYASEAPTDRAQIDLSLARATAVAAALIRRGVSPDRLLVAGYGNRCAGWSEPPRTCLRQPNDLVGVVILWANGAPLPGPRICPEAEELVPPIPERFLRPDEGP